MKNVTWCLAFVVAMTVGCALMRSPEVKTVERVLIDLATAKCVAEAPTDTQALACNGGRDILLALLASKKAGLANMTVRRGYRDAYDAGVD